MSKRVIGIDPGEKGGIAVIDDKGLRTYNMPESFPEIYDLLKELKCDGVMALLENVGHGIPGQSSSATAKFARHCGHLEMALYALGIRTETFTPQKWQKYYSNQLGKSTGLSKGEWKNKLKGLAKQLYPETKVTLNTADAILLANYGWRETL